MTTDSTTTATAASERPEVPAEVLATIETISGRVRAVRDVIEDWALTHSMHRHDNGLMPDADGELWAANAALSIASELLRLYTRTDEAWCSFAIGRLMKVEPSERPAISWELVREPLYDISSRLHALIQGSADCYRARTGDATGLPDAWKELGQVQTAVSLSLQTLALYEDRRVRPNPETGGS